MCARFYLSGKVPGKWGSEMKYQVVCGYEDLSFESENEVFSEAVVVWAEGREVAIKGFEGGHEKQARAYVARQLKKYDEKGIAASAGVYVAWAIN